LRTWLHRIAVNACLNELEREERRVLPLEYGPEAKPGDPFERWDEVLWLGPTPSDPQQRVEDLESIELAFVAAVQHLPANQRAALIMFDVLELSAGEIAEAMGTSAPSVNSALQRARERLKQLLPSRTQQATLAELGDEAQRELVTRYTDAMRRHDVDALLHLLAEDATWPAMSCVSVYSVISATSPSRIHEHPAVAVWVARSGLRHAVIATLDDQVSLGDESLGGDDIRSGELLSEGTQQLGKDRRWGRPRNHQLNHSAFALGRLCASGQLDAGLAVGELTRVATGIGLGPRETAATVASGMDAGQHYPRVPSPSAPPPPTQRRQLLERDSGAPGVALGRASPAATPAAPVLLTAAPARPGAEGRHEHRTQALRAEAEQPPVIQP